MNQIRMLFKFIALLFPVLMFSCIHPKVEQKKAPVENDSLSQNTQNEAFYEENGNDEYIASDLFEKWKGKYVLKQENQIDAFGRLSTIFSELLLIAPDSCIFESWLADEQGIRYESHANVQKFLGVIYATTNQDSIEFYTKKVLHGGSSNLAPLFTLTKKENSYIIYSLITSAANHGIEGLLITKEH